MYKFQNTKALRIFDKFMIKSGSSTKFIDIVLPFILLDIQLKNF